MILVYPKVLARVLGEIIIMVKDELLYKYLVRQMVVAIE